MTLKIVLNGETFDYDGTKQPMSEALAIERLYKKRYVQWQEDLDTGVLEAFCILAWIIWRRDGRDVPYEDIIEGRADFDVSEMVQSILEARKAAAAAAAADPTGPPAPDGTPGTGESTSPSSPASSASGRGKSRSSTSATSKRSST